MNVSPKNSDSNTNWNILFVCWLIASLSALGSLFFSQVLKYPPCDLCWYQRICLFPLVLTLLAGLFPLNKSVVKFSLPLTAIGWIISLYHNLLYMGIIPEPLVPCGKDLSCTKVQLNVFGFVTIPLLAFVSFTLMAALLIILQRRFSK